MGVLAMSACLVALYFALATRHPQDMLGMLDLRIYRAGASTAWHGGAVYNDHYAAGLPFTYPPFAALFFIPLAALPLSLAKLVVLIGSIGAIGVACWAVTGVLTDTHKRLAVVVAASAIALWLEPVQQTLKFGQVNLLLMVLVVVDVMYSERRWSGVGVGIAAALKLTPLIFVPYLLLTRRPRVAARAMLTFAGCIAVSWLVLPAQSHRYWLDGVFVDSNRIGNVGYVGNQSLNAVVVRLFGDHSSSHALWLLLAASGAALGLFAAAKTFELWGDAPGMLVTALTALLVSPVSWSHHWVWIAPAIAFGLAVAYSRRSWVILGVVTATLVVFFAWPMQRQPGGAIWSLPFSLDNHEHEWRGLQLLVGNIEVLFGIGALVALVIGLVVAKRPLVVTEPKRPGNDQWSVETP